METVPIFRQLTTMFEENLGAARKNLLAASFSKRRLTRKCRQWGQVTLRGTKCVRGDDVY